MKLIVYARVPELGKVKTRLAAQMGEPEALAAYRSLLNNILERMSGLKDVQKELCITGVDVRGECARLAQAYRFSLTEQAHGDLGFRMQESFRLGLATHSRVLLMGSDCPLLDEFLVRKAFAELERHDAFFVPVEDGGYSLLGLRKLIPALFSDMAWSTGSVMQESRVRLRDSGASWVESPTLWDIDEPIDWQRWIASDPARKPWPTDQ